MNELPVSDKTPIINDTTLRDGEQSAGVVISLDENWRLRGVSMPSACRNSRSTSRR